MGLKHRRSRARRRPGTQRGEGGVRRLPELAVFDLYALALFVEGEACRLQ